MVDTLHRVVKIEELETAICPYDRLESARESPYLALLESRGAPSKLARWSFLGVDPFLVFRATGASAFGGPPGALVRLEGDPFSALAALLKRHGAPVVARAAGLPPLLGGAIGYLGYDLMHLLEEVPDCGTNDLELPDACLMFFDSLLAFDGHEQRGWLTTTGFGPTHAAAEHAASEAMAQARSRHGRGSPSPPRGEDLVARRREVLDARPRLTESDLLGLGVRPVLAKSDYLGVVRNVKEHILEGDVFEVCTTNRFDTETSLSGSELYRALSAINEAPFAAYLRFPEAEVISSSPERFLRLDRDRWAETRPMKGTRPRGRTEAEDAAARDELGAAEKDRAEHMMIVDLARNDLGRVCEFDTVTVPELAVVETYPFVHQLVSTVRGHLRPQLSAIDLVRAAFPSGSMTGAPKIEAMKIIAQLEPVKRGIYSGCIGYFDFDGAFDFSVVIRTFIKKGNWLTFHTGGALVDDSDPEDEYQETLDKAHGMVTALQIATEAAR
jgi:para-aminobenzoate synthetase component 1